MIDFRNINTVWASVGVETLQRLGLTTAIVSPGSRSTPLTLAFALHPKIEAIPVLDERSAAFFALGLAQKLKLPTVLVCTSGTAAANFYPAVIEAQESRVPLIILTADRPPELRNCHAGQTIDQVKLYGNYPNWQTELGLPSLDLQLLQYLRQTLIYTWERSLSPIPGPVHLNCPFCDPLPPLPQAETNHLKEHFPPDFFSFIQWQPSLHTIANFKPYLDTWKSSERGVIIAGVAKPHFSLKYCQAIAHLSKYLKWPVLGEGLSPIRNHTQLNPFLISTYDLILRNSEFSQKLRPDFVIQIGDLPTSKQLRTWLKNLSTQIFVLDPSYQNLNSLHHSTTHLRCSIEQFVESLPQQPTENYTTPYLRLWCDAEAKVRQNIDQEMIGISKIIEPKVAWLLSEILPPQTPLFIANSMPVRDVEFFWKPNSKGIQPFFNRGANGIDGTLSTALGVAHRNQSSVLLTGDLALLHDTNGFLLAQKFVGHLTIILINNHGGGIFEMLPIAQFDPPFEEFFATPQKINFAQLCATYGVNYQQILSWEQLTKELNPLPNHGIRLLEIPTDRKQDSQWRLQYLNQFAVGLESG